MYRKPTHTDQYLNFSSNNPKSHKISVIRALVDRAFDFCSPEFLEAELLHIKKTLKSNGYQINLVNKHIQRRQNSHMSRSLPCSTRSDMKYISVPYVPNTTEKMNRVLRPYNISLASKPTVTLRKQLCRLKDKTPLIDNIDVIYKILCLDCPRFYIGETGRQLSIRMEEHKRNVQNHCEHSQIFQHLANEGHRANFNSPHIIDRCSNWRQRKLIEASYTHSAADMTLNRAEDISAYYSKHM